LQIKGLHSRKR